MKFNEDSRVKIPAVLHLTRLGYTYLSLKTLQWDTSSNIVPSLFRSSVAAINPTATATEIENALGQLDLALDNEDLGKVFFEKITATSGLKLIDFEDFDRNSFHVVTEFACIKDDEEFRPDITLLINGLPLVFIEVKKPNNRDGSAFKAEADARIAHNAAILTNPAFASAEMTKLIIEQFKTKHQLSLTAGDTQFINTLVMKEYLAEFHGQHAA